MALDATPEQIERLKNLSHSTALVEERLKEAELICGQVVYPAVNELRYLARNLSSVLAMSLENEGQQDRCERHLLDAELCCQRANHDITDAVFTYIALEIGAIRKAMGASLIQGHFDDYAGHMDSLQMVHELMAKSRGSERKRRAEIYLDIEKNYLPSLLEFYKALLKNKNLLGEHYRAIQRTQLGVRAASVFAFIASMASILSFMGYSASDLWPFGSNSETETPPLTDTTETPATSCSGLQTSESAHIKCDYKNVCLSVS